VLKRPDILTKMDHVAGIGTRLKGLVFGVKPVTGSTIRRKRKNIKRRVGTVTR